MNVRNVISLGVAASLLLVAGVASAQTVPSSVVGVTSNPVTTSVSPGSGVPLGTVVLAAPSSGNASISSVPLTLTASGGGSPSNLSNCQLSNNSSGQSITTGVNAVNSLQNGSNTFNLDTPLNLSSTGGATTLQIRCDVAAGTPSGSIFQFSAGAPTYAPGLMVSLLASPTVSVGKTLQSLALITLDATRSGQNVNVSSLPIVVTGNNAATSQLSNCSVRNIANIGVALNTGTNAITNLSNGSTVTLDTPLTVPAGSSVVLALTCDVSTGAAVGGTYAVSLAPGTVMATNASNGSLITPAANFASNGSQDPISGVVTLAAPGVTTPGVPNTGAGGNALQTLFVLAIAGIAALVSARYLAMRRS